MKVFKFGGASITNAERVKNLASVIQSSGEKNLVVVISAMGKITNALEMLCMPILKTGLSLEIHRMM